MKNALAIVLTGKKSKGMKNKYDEEYEEMEEEKSKVDKAESDAGSQLLEAIDSGSPDAVFSAIQDIIRLVQ